MIIRFQCELRKCSIKCIHSCGWMDEKFNSNVNHMLAKTYITGGECFFKKKYLSHNLESATTEMEFPLKIPDGWLWSDNITIATYIKLGPSSLRSFCKGIVISSQLSFTKLAKWVELRARRCVSKLPKWIISDFNVHGAFKQNLRRKMIHSELCLFIEGLPEYSVQAQLLAVRGLLMFYGTKKNHMKGVSYVLLWTELRFPPHPSISCFEALTPTTSGCDCIWR